jgi:hypothetical protein
MIVCPVLAAPRELENVLPSRETTCVDAEKWIQGLASSWRTLDRCIQYPILVWGYFIDHSNKFENLKGVNIIQSLT